jgi:hypothetical protein
MRTARLKIDSKGYINVPKKVREDYPDKQLYILPDHRAQTTSLRVSGKSMVYYFLDNVVPSKYNSSFDSMCRRNMTKQGRFRVFGIKDLNKQAAGRTLVVTFDK